MMIESNYSMNVAKQTGRKAFGGGDQYTHFCRIELGWQLPEEAKKRAAEIRKLFPEPLYQTSLTFVDCKGYHVDF